VWPFSRHQSAAAVRVVLGRTSLPQRREHERLGGDESDKRLRRFTDFAADDEQRVVGTGRDRPLICAPQMVPLYALVRVRRVRRGLDWQQPQRWLQDGLSRRRICATALASANFRTSNRNAGHCWRIPGAHVG
jgi:hypothetical protein